MELFLWHIYYSLYIRREASRDLHTEQAFKEDFLLFFGKSVAVLTLMYVVFSVHTLLVLPCLWCIFCLPIHAQEAKQGHAKILRHVHHVDCEADL